MKTCLCITGFPCVLHKAALCTIVPSSALLGVLGNLEPRWGAGSALTAPPVRGIGFLQEAVVPLAPAATGAALAGVGVVTPGVPAWGVVVRKVLAAGYPSWLVVRYAKGWYAGQMMQS